MFYQWFFFKNAMNYLGTKIIFVVIYWTHLDEKNNGPGVKWRTVDQFFFKLNSSLSHNFSLISCTVCMKGWCLEKQRPKAFVKLFGQLLELWSQDGYHFLPRQKCLETFVGRESTQLESSNSKWAQLPFLFSFLFFACH